MNFATLKGLTIPEGVVTQIADASGNVLWKKAPSGATVTFYKSGIVIMTATFQMGDQTVTSNDISGETVFSIPIGTTIIIQMSVSGLFNGMIKLNENIIRESSISGMTNTGSLYYEHIIQGNISIELLSSVVGSDGKNKSCISITEL